MKTVDEVITFIQSEIARLEDIGTYSEDIEYLLYLLSKIEEPK